MKGGYVAVVAFAAVVVMVFGEDHPIRPIPEKCPSEDSLNYTVHIRHENDCTKFYKCFRGTPIEMSCPKMNKKGDKLHFNALLQVCDFPNRAGCIGTTSPVVSEPTTPEPWKPVSDCRFADDKTKIPHETRCYLYYECVNHRPVLGRCAEGLHFSPPHQLCKQPSESECPIKDVCRDYKSNVGIYIADPTSCKHVYYCKGTNTARYPCEQDAEWSVQEEKCVKAEEANCRLRYD